MLHHTRENGALTIPKNVKYKATGTPVIAAEVGALLRVRPGQGKGVGGVQDGEIVTVVKRASYQSFNQDYVVQVRRANRGFEPVLLVRRFEVVEEIVTLSPEVGGFIRATQTVAGMTKGFVYEVTQVHASGSLTVKIDGFDRTVYPSEIEVVNVLAKPGDVLYLKEGTQGMNAQGGSEAVVEQPYIEGDLWVVIKWTKPIFKTGATGSYAGRQNDGSYSFNTFTTEKPQPVKGEVEVGAWIGDLDALDALPEGSIVQAMDYWDKTPLAKTHTGSWIIANHTQETDFRRPFLRAQVEQRSGLRLIHHP